MKLEPLYQKSNKFATPFPELGKSDATHFEGERPTGSQRNQVELSRIFCLTKYTKSIVLFQKKSFFLKESSENDALQAVVAMQKGEIVEEGTTEKLYFSPEHEYTRTLLQAVNL